jgi:hypothetical protein
LRSAAANGSNRIDRNCPLSHAINALTYVYDLY